MSFEKTIPFKTIEGNEYLLKFSLFEQSYVSIPIVDISLVLVSTAITLNHQSTFSFFTNEIIAYLNKHNVVLYYYCDREEVKRRDKSISPQEYRSKLFNTLFNKINDETLVLKNINLDDTKNGKHFISLISKIYNEEFLDKILNEMNNLNK